MCFETCIAATNVAHATDQDSIEPSDYDGGNISMDEPKSYLIGHICRWKKKIRQASDIGRRDWTSTGIMEEGLSINRHHGGGTEHQQASEGDWVSTGIGRGDWVSTVIEFVAADHSSCLVLP